MGCVMKIGDIEVEVVHPFKIKIPATGGMRADGIIYTTLDALKQEESAQCMTQVMNVAHLYGIVGPSMAMPDIHWGYGFPIGGVAAFDVEEGMISPGGVGYDINCGVRLLRSGLSRTDIQGKVEPLIHQLFWDLPCGVGARGRLKLSGPEMKKVLKNGSRWALDNGYAREEDVANTEEGGALAGADPDSVSERALKRGSNQLGTVGSGNHFVEIGYVAEVYDEYLARAMGLHLNQVTVGIHCGSRGLGHQVCDDFLHQMARNLPDLPFELPDKQLACAPFKSHAGQEYFRAMNAAANFAYCNRQILTHWTRQAFEKILQAGPATIALEVVYDVAHNIAKVETHNLAGQPRQLLVHRKGATRAFPPGHPDVPPVYRSVGQPVFIPGDMGRCSYVLVGTEKAMEETFGTTCHGAGRVLSRHRAKRLAKGRDIAQEMKERGIFVKAGQRSALAEEASYAYKDVSKVVETVEGAGLSKKVAKLIPMGVIKG